MTDYTKNLQGADLLLLYRTKYGTTKRYAQWIAEALNTEAFEITRFSPGMLESCSILLFGSSVHVGKIKGFSFIKNNWKTIKNKRIIIFASTGSSKITSKDNAVLKASLPPNISQNINYFPLPGGYNYGKLDFTDKLLMNFGPMRKLRVKAILMRDKKSREQLASLHQATDWSNKEAINPILDFIRAVPNSNMTK